VQARLADSFRSARSSLAAISILHRPTTFTPPQKSNALCALSALCALMALSALKKTFPGTPHASDLER
jgi:hypothetical protein